jgi:hypothetical protein
MSDAGFDMTDKIHFMNVDLDVFSRSPLEPLAAAFGNRVAVLYVGREGALFGGHFELADSYKKDADGLVRGFVDLVLALPPRARKLWNGAKSRDFNIGIQSALKPRCHELRLSAETLEAVARVRGSVVITTYAPAPEASGGAVKMRRKRRRTT